MRGEHERYSAFSDCGDAATYPADLPELRETLTE
jgi:hypothetical protein